MRRGDRAGRPEARNIINPLRLFINTRILSPCCKYTKEIRVLSERAVCYFSFFNPSRTRRLVFRHVERHSTHCFLTHARWRFSCLFTRILQNTCISCQRESTFICRIAILVEGVFQKSEMAFSPSVPLTLLCAWRPRCASHV